MGMVGTGRAASIAFQSWLHRRGVGGGLRGSFVMATAMVDGKIMGWLARRGDRPREGTNRVDRGGGCVPQDG